MVITTAQLHLTKPDSDSVQFQTKVSEIGNGEDL